MTQTQKQIAQQLKVGDRVEPCDPSHRKVWGAGIIQQLLGGYAYVAVDSNERIDGGGHPCFRLSALRLAAPTPNPTPGSVQRLVQAAEAVEGSIRNAIGILEDHHDGVGCESLREASSGLRAALAEFKEQT